MSNLLEQASLVLIPSGYKEDVVYSQIPLDGSGDMTLTRASNGTRINSAGLVEVCPWNLVQNSENFSAVWTAQNSTITTNSIVAPNGTTTADSLIASNGVNGASGVYVPETTSVVKTMSCYVKKGSKRWAAFIAYNGNSNCWFDLDNGVVGTRGANYSASSITSVGNGWFRIDAVMTVAIGTDVNIGIYATDNDNSLTCTGDGTTVSSYIWGFQLNIGSTAKPYFPTTDRLNVPRLTYQNGGGGCPSLLLEKQSTNLALQSNAFNTSPWVSGSQSGTNPVITPNYGISPDGTQNAVRIELARQNVGTSYSQIYQYPIAITSGQPYTWSVYLKSISGTPTISIIGDFGRPSVTLTSEWVRYTGTYTAGSSQTQLELAILGSNYATGNSLSADFLAYGYQIEQSSYPTSYIPTTSSSATRVADAIANQTTSIAQAFTDNTKGTIFFDLKNIKFGTSAAARFRFGNSSSALQFAIYLDSVGVGVYAYQGAGYVINTNLATSQKLAIRFDGTSITGFSQGVQRNTVTAGSSFNIDQMTDNNTENFCFEINEFVLFNSVLTNAECIALTTI